MPARAIARIVQATDEAEKLRQRPGRAPDVKTKLGLGVRSLPISTLRGRFVDNRDWLANPAAPAIMFLQRPKTIGLARVIFPATSAASCERRSLPTKIFTTFYMLYLYNVQQKCYYLW